MLRAHLLLLLGLLALSTVAQQKPDPQSLFKKANTVTLRLREGSPPQHTVVSFRAFHLTAGSLDGHFEQYWKDPFHFRTEDSVGSFNVIIVRTPHTIWKPQGFVFLPFSLRSLEDLISGYQREIVDQAGFHKVRREKVQGRDSLCTEKRESYSRSKYCFDASLGVLLRSEQRYSSPGDFDRVVVEEYSEYTTFGSELYPRKMVLQENGSTLIEATVDSIDPWASSDDMLRPPQGYSPHPVCDSGYVKAPRVTFDPDPEYPQNHKGKKSVTFRVLVNEQGEVAAKQVQVSGGKDFDDAADRVLQRWKFEPARCEGQAIPVEINVQFNFRK